MRTVKASEFKAKCLQIMDEVAETQEPVVITKRGVPVSQLVSVKRVRRTLYGAMKGGITMRDDLVAPVGVEWEAEAP